MRKSLKTLLIVAGILCAAGLTAGAVGFTLLGTDPGSYSLAPQLEEKNYQSSAEGIDSIELLVENVPVVIQPSSDGQISIRYRESEERPCEITKENGTLRIRQTYSQHWYSSLVYGIFSSFRYLGDEIVLQVPENSLDSLSVENSNQGIRIEGISAQSQLSLVTSNGRIDAENVGAEHCRFQTSNSSIELSQLNSAGELECYSTNGRLSVEQANCGTFKARTSNGPMELSGVICTHTLVLENSNGKIDMEETSAGTALSAVTSNSFILLEKAVCPQILLKTSNGAISGSILGNRADYSVIGKTSNGSNNLGEDIDETRPNRLEAFTSNAGIDLVFERAE